MNQKAPNLNRHPLTLAIWNALLQMQYRAMARR
jgi:hypothetical protein